MNLTIDATSKISGGGRVYLINLLKFFDKKYFDKIYIWAPQEFLDLIADNNNLIKKTSNLVEMGSLGIFLWRLLFRDKEFFKVSNCVFSPFGDYTGKFRPYVSMSQNMLIFEKNQRQKFKFSLTRLKLELLHFIQKKSILNASGTIFISNYARNYITNFLQLDKKKTTIINHGISNSFYKKPKNQKNIKFYNIDFPFKILYVSNILPYKNHITVVKAISDLRREGLPVELTLIGRVDSKSTGNALKKNIKKNDRKTNFIKWHENINHKQIKKYYHESDCFVFASSCENMPNILIEAMSSGLPVVCSNIGPMKEFIGDYAYFFDPNSTESLKLQLKKMLSYSSIRQEKCDMSFNLSKKYDWDQCADKTFSYLAQNIVNFKNV
jgi:glycosyltransferase involved in cell wall biosynthesis